MPNNRVKEKTVLRKLAPVAAVIALVSVIGLAWTARTIWRPANVAPIIATFEARLAAALKEIESQNLSVIIGVSHGGAKVQLHEFGALAKDDIPPEETQIDINSITKTVTGVMVAKLVEQGRLRFDEPLKEVFPDVPQDKAKITIHQLLTHGSGFPESLGDDAERLEREDFLQRAWQTDLLSPPGEIYRYSNAGYGVLAAVIELRSGKSYETYLQEDVLSGLGFVSTGYASVYKDKLSMRTASGDAISSASWGNQSPYWTLIGNGGLVSTVPEMIAFRAAFRTGKMVSPDLVNLVQYPHLSEGEGTSFYGYGLVVQDAPEIGRFYWHDGGNEVFSAQWGDIAATQDILFTAGQDQDAFAAMSILVGALYGLGG